MVVLESKVLGNVDLVVPLRIIFLAYLPRGGAREQNFWGKPSGDANGPIGSFFATWWR